MSLVGVYALFCFGVGYLSAVMLMNVSLPFHHACVKGTILYQVTRNALQVFESLTQQVVEYLSVMILKKVL